MDGQQIDDAAKLTSWLVGKPKTLEQIISVRVVLRIIPKLSHARENWLKQFVLVIFRSVIMSWSASFYNNDKMSKAFYSASAAMKSSYSKDPKRQFASASIQPWSVLKTAQFVIDTTSKIKQLKMKEFIKSATDTKIDEQIFWYNLNQDCKWFEVDRSTTEPARLARFKLWWSAQSTQGKTDWQNLSEKLLKIDPNYSVWIDWYERRIRGERAAFDIPGDKGRIEDRKILRRLAEATDEEFWGKGHEYVNATLKGWLDEARARVAPEIIPAEASGVLDIGGTAEAALGPPPIPAQNTNALSFRANEEGRITIDGDALASQLRTDAGARDRHEEAVSEARHALGRCQGNNAAARLTGLLNNYLAAAGESVETAKPSLLVLRGERLRQELARYEVPDHMLPPVADDLLLDLKGWQSAHNMMVGLDPVLVGMDTAILGPDRQPSLIPPDEIRQKSEAADQAGILADEVVEVLIEAANLAPEVPEPGNRLTVLSNEMMRNLFIEAFSIALNHPGKTAGGVVAGSAIFAAFGASGLGAVSVMGSIKAAEYLVNHRDWIIDRLGNTPTWQALIAKLADWLEEVTPFDRK